MDVINYLEKDHKTVLSLLAKLKKTTSSAIKSRQNQFKVIKQELYLHEQVEQKVLYPALKKKDKDHILEAYQEHHLVNMILADIESIPFNNESWKAKVVVLIECLTHHIKEERNELFPLTKKVFNKEQREDMTIAMETIKKELKASI
jgi:hemerythrin superfamily protein